MNNDKTINIIIKRRDDKHVEAKLNWFLRQPGCYWEINKLNSPDNYCLNITKKSIFLEKGEEHLSFHPSMALLRIMNILRGEPDRYLYATGLTEGDILLDATLGLGTDALVGAWAVGEQGKVIGIEHSAILCALVKEGLFELAQGNFPNMENPAKLVNPEKRLAWQNLAKCAQRLEVFWGHHLEFLGKQPDASFDVIYFDPMFRQTRTQSASIRPLHHLSNSQPLMRESILEACRVARKKVVLKERKDSPEFVRLGFTVTAGGRYSAVDYGTIVINHRS